IPARIRISRPPSHSAARGEPGGDAWGDPWGGLAGSTAGVEPGSAGTAPPSAGPCSLSRSDITPLSLFNLAHLTENPVERIEQGRLIGPLGNAPVVPRQAGEGSVSGRADR